MNIEKCCKDIINDIKGHTQKTVNIILKIDYIDIQANLVVKAKISNPIDTCIIPPLHNDSKLPSGIGLDRDIRLICINDGNCNKNGLYIKT